MKDSTTICNSTEQESHYLAKFYGKCGHLSVTIDDTEIFKSASAI